MLVLKNVKKIDNRIEADFCFPDIDVHGSVVYDIQKNQIDEISCKEQEDLENIYGIVHLKRVLEMMVEHNRYPETYTYLWF